MDKLAEMLRAKADTMIEGEQIFHYVAKWLDLLPPADVVEVVRCKDCKRFLEMETSPSYDGQCLGYGYLVEANHYCSYGEKENEH
jgi:hypothetical protein